MTAPEQKPDAADRLAAWAKKSEQAQAQIAQVRGKGTAVDGYLVVTVDAGGKMLDVKTDTPVADLRAEDLQSAIMRAYKLACQDAEKQTAAITTDLYKDPKIRKILTTLNPNAKLPEAQTAAEQAGPDPDDDEEWNDASAWLRKA